MRGLVVSSFAVIAALSTSPAAAQSAGASADVQSYLCSFAGKCGETVAATDDESPVKAAPATKGFRLAAPSQSIPAPATKGFRIAGPGQTTPAPTTKGFRIGGAQTAPATKGFRIARTPAPATKPARSRYTAPRPAYVAAAAAPAYGAARPAPVAGTRADLMLAFEYNSDRMTPEAIAKARGFAKALMMPELAGKRFMIEGHTDARGNRESNIELSRRRAQSVADFLVAEGVERGRVEVKGVGPDEPLPNRSRNAEANRRVEAVLLG